MRSDVPSGSRGWSAGVIKGVDWLFKAVSNGITETISVKFLETPGSPAPAALNVKIHLQ